MSKMIEGGEVALVTRVSVLRDLVLKRTHPEGTAVVITTPPSHQPIATRLRYVGSFGRSGTDLVVQMSE